MTRVRMLAVAVAILAWGSELYGERPPDRDALLAALQQRAVTGVPRHLDHDEGEDLQAAVTAALAADPNDGDLAWAAARASVALSPHVNPPITDGAPPAAWVEVYPALSLPWRMKANGVIDVSLDGSAWRHGAEIHPGDVHVSIPLDRVFHKAANRPGFHVLRFQASLQFSGLPGGVPNVETRELPARTYGVTGTSPAGMRAATILNSAARASAATFDSALPATTLDSWVRAQTAALEPRSTPAVWTSRWCESRSNVDADIATSVCAVAMVPAPSPLGGHAEIWVRVAGVDMSGAKPTWTAEPPALEGVELLRPPMQSSVRLSEVPFALRADEATWPQMSVALDAEDVTLMPANPRQNEPVRIQARVRNTGRADVYGLTIDLLVFDTPERVLLRRRFVRAIAAGESAVVETSLAFPLGYGGVLVSATALGEHSPLACAPVAPDGSTSFSHAARLVHPELAPRGYADRVRASVGCKPGCPNVR